LAAFFSLFHSRHQQFRNHQPNQNNPMATQRYFPPREGDQIGWFTNLNNRYATYAVTLSIDATRQAKTQLVLNWLIWIWQTYLPSRRMEGPAATAYRNNAAYGPISTPSNPNPPALASITPPLSTPFFGMLTWLFQEIDRWKTSEGYNDDIGEILGIVGPEETGPDLNTVAPPLDASVFPSVVKLIWGWVGVGAGDWGRD